MTSPLHGVITDEQLGDLQARNRHRAWAAIKAMGTTYCCHPANTTKRRKPITPPPADLPGFNCAGNVVWRGAVDPRTEKMARHAAAAASGLTAFVWR